jgi:hypothetical protein
MYCFKDKTSLPTIIAGKLSQSNGIQTGEMILYLIGIMTKNMKMLFSSQINNCPDGIISKLRTYLYVDIAAFLLARRHTAPKLAPVFLKGIEWNRN